MNKKIAVLIPCHDEALTIGKVVADFRTNLPEAEIYICDNGSTDSTYEIGVATGVRVFKERMLGKGNAVRKLFHIVDADIYILVDGDDTYPADVIKKMLLPVVEGDADIVVGDRLSGTYFQTNSRQFHNAGNKIVRFLINRLFDVKLKDVLSGYRVMTRNFVKNFPVMSEGFEIETEMTVHALERGYVIEEYPIIYRNRPNGSESKLSTFSDGRRVLMMIMVLFRDYRPMAFFGMASVLSLSIGLCMFVPVVVEYWRTGLVPRFPTLIVSCFIMLFSMLLFFVGLILDVMKRNSARQWRMQVLRDER